MPSTLDALRTIMREEGWRALYRGIVPSLLLVSLFTYLWVTQQRELLISAYFFLISLVASKMYFSIVLRCMKIDFY